MMTSKGRISVYLRASALSALCLSCATIQDPPGGPRDFAPPEILAITPDSGAVVPTLKDAAWIRFSEVVSERPGLPLDQMVLLSPRPKKLDVDWHRTGISIRPSEGWKPDMVYRITLLPGMTDLRNNKMKDGKTIVFSTGAAIPATKMTGRVVDWESGTAGMRALVEAIRMPDSVVYWDLADSTGTYSMVSVPPGRYILTATVDKNNNRRREYREPFDSAVVTLDSTTHNVLWAFTHDSIGPKIRTVMKSDSITLRVEFTQMLAPGRPDSTSVSVAQLPDSTPIAVASIYTQEAFDSIQSATRQAKGDTTSGNRAPAAGQPGGQPQPAGQPAPSAAQPPSPLPTQPGPPLGQQNPTQPEPTPTVAQPGAPGLLGPGRTTQPVDSALLRLLKERPKLSPSLVVRTGTPIVPGGRYVIRARVRNPSGAEAESMQVLAVPAAPDSTRKAR